MSHMNGVEVFLSVIGFFVAPTVVVGILVAVGRKVGVAVVFGAVLASGLLTAPLAYADSSWNTTINGQQLPHMPEPPGSSSGQVTCGHDPIHIVGGGGYVNLAEGTLQVLQISLTDTAGISYLYDPKQNQQQHIGGDVQVNQSGKTYKVTGHISPYMNLATGQRYLDATPVPFDYQATCP
jgi:hypothetical protein